MSEATGTPRKVESRSAFRSETPIHESLYRGRHNASFQNKDLLQHLTEDNNHNMSADSYNPRRRTL